MTCFYIAGATGYTGRALVKTLRQAEIRVIAHIRPDSPSMNEMEPVFQSNGAEIDKTPWTSEEIAKTIKTLKPTHVCSLLGTTRAKAKAAAKTGRSATYETVERDMSLMLLEAAMHCEPKPRFVFLSAMGADKTGGNRYMRARTDVEHAIFASGLSYFIARPAFVTGPDRSEFRLMERSAAIISDGLLDMTGMLGAKVFRDSYRSLTATALAEGMRCLALRTDNVIASPYLLRHPNADSN